MIHASEKFCPRCRSLKMKNWDELTGDELLLAERLPLSADYPASERKKHRLCIRCWFEVVSPNDTRV